MLKRGCFLIWGILWLAACGPDTILVRPELDTPAQHIANGEMFLELGKYSDALREFLRARELDPDNVPARVGMALAAAHSGDLDAGLDHLAEAEPFIRSAEDRETLEKGYDRLNDLMHRKGAPQ